MDSTRELRFEGHSDDTFGEYGRTNQDYDNCASGAPIVYEVRAGDEAMLVWGQYGGAQWPPEVPPCWMIGVQQVAEDVSIPAWPLRYAATLHGYSPALVIAAPEGATVCCLNRSSNGD